MPARQRGFARRRGPSWLAVWRAAGRERSRGGFETKTEALDYANHKAEETVERETAIRFGDPVPHPPSAVSTLTARGSETVGRSGSSGLRQACVSSATRSGSVCAAA